MEKKKLDGKKTTCWMIVKEKGRRKFFQCCLVLSVLVRKRFGKMIAYANNLAKLLN